MAILRPNSYHVFSKKSTQNHSEKGGNRMEVILDFSEK
jgi:hypothetical protein